MHVALHAHTLDVPYSNWTGRPEYFAANVAEALGAHAATCRLPVSGLSRSSDHAPSRCTAAPTVTDVIPETLLGVDLIYCYATLEVALGRETPSPALGYHGLTVTGGGGGCEQKSGYYEVYQALSTHSNSPDKLSTVTA